MGKACRACRGPGMYVYGIVISRQISDVKILTQRTKYCQGISSINIKYVWPSWETQAPFTSAASVLMKTDTCPVDVITNSSVRVYHCACTARVVKLPNWQKTSNWNTATELGTMTYYMGRYRPCIGCIWVVLVALFAVQLKISWCLIWSFCQVELRWQLSVNGAEPSSNFYHKLYCKSVTMETPYTNIQEHEKSIGLLNKYISVGNVAVL